MTATTIRPSALDYETCGAFLTEWLAWKQILNPRYSKRLFARRVGRPNSPALFSKLANDDQRLYGALLEAVIREVDLEGDEATYFRLMAGLTNVDTAADRERIERERKSFLGYRKGRQLSAQYARYLSNWYYPAIQEMAQCAGFRFDPDWIARHLMPRITSEQARDALEILDALGLLRQGPDGAPVSEPQALLTEVETSAETVREYYQGVLQRSRESLERIYDPAHPDFHTECQFGVLTMAIPVDDLPQIREAMVAFQQKLLGICENLEAPNDRVYMAFLQLFPLSGVIEQDSD